MLLPELWRGGYRATHFRCQIEKGDNMVDYEQSPWRAVEGHFAHHRYFLLKKFDSRMRKWAKYRD
jgi:hypothetical protein